MGTFSLRDLIKREGITDILYYGDRRPYHQVAAEVAREIGISSYVYEFGYLRPNWLTLERNGMSRWSHFPNDPKEILRIGAQFPAPDLSERYPSSIAVELTHEIFYTLTSYFFHLAYPFYNADRYYNPLVEYLTGIPKQLVAPRRAREAQEFVRQTDANQTTLFPLSITASKRLSATPQRILQAPVRCHSTCYQLICGEFQSDRSSRLQVPSFWTMAASDGQNVSGEQRRRPESRTEFTTSKAAILPLCSGMHAAQY